MMQYSTTKTAGQRYECLVSAYPATKRVTDTDTRKTASSKVRNPWLRSECRLQGSSIKKFA